MSDKAGLSTLDPQPGAKNDQHKADIINHLRDNRTVMASMNIGTNNFRAALGELIRERYVTVDHDFACHLTEKGEKYGL